MAQIFSASPARKNERRLPTAVMLGESRCNGKEEQEEKKGVGRAQTEEGEVLTT